MKKRIAIAVAHAHWRPHTGGGKTQCWSENGLSQVVSNVFAARLRDKGYDCQVFEMPEQVGRNMRLRCYGDCDGRRECGKYNAGLIRVARMCKNFAGPSGFSVSFHIDKAPPGRSGPLFFVRDRSALSNEWASAYIDEWDQRTDVGDRRIWGLPSNSDLFPSNPWFVRKSTKHAVLVEMFNGRSATDSAMFDHGDGLNTVVECAMSATLKTLKVGETDD